MLFHSLDPAVRPDDAAALHRAARPGAQLSVLTFTDAFKGALLDLGITQHHLRTTLTDAGRNLTSLDQTTFLIVAAAMLASLQRSGMNVETDENGWTLVPVWRALAKILDLTTTSPYLSGDRSIRSACRASPDDN